jgi:hypothetical protein
LFAWVSDCARWALCALPKMGYLLTQVWSLVTPFICGTAFLC